MLFSQLNIPFQKNHFYAIVTCYSDSPNGHKATTPEVSAMFFPLLFLACSEQTEAEVALEINATPTKTSVVINNTSIEAWRPETTVQLDCPWLSQERDAEESTLNCGPTSLVMAAACINRTTPSYENVIDLISWMSENDETYYETGENYSGSYTNTVQLTNAGNEYYKLSAERFYETVMLNDMYDDLASGVPVLIATYNQGENASDVMDGGGGHFMLLVGMTSTHIIVNDPGPYSADLGESHEYTIDSFEANWQNAGVRFLTK